MEGKQEMILQGFVLSPPLAKPHLDVLILDLKSGGRLIHGKIRHILLSTTEVVQSVA